jgi:hypothetical protein
LAIRHPSLRGAEGDQAISTREYTLSEIASPRCARDDGLPPLVFVLRPLPLAFAVIGGRGIFAMPGSIAIVYSSEYHGPLTSGAGGRDHCFQTAVRKVVKNGALSCRFRVEARC